MRSKNILSIAAFIIAFSLSTAFASLFVSKSEPFSSIVVTPSYNSKKTSCFKNRGKGFTADKIETIIKQDISHETDRNKRIYQNGGEHRPSFLSSSFPEYADTISEYVSNSEDLSYANTPQDFQAAWLKHMKAWRDYSVFLDTMKSSAKRAELSEAKFFELDNMYGSEIDDTWHEVLRIGRNHGADVY